MRGNIACVVLKCVSMLVALFLQAHNGQAAGYCSFPTFLWQPAPGTSQSAHATSRDWVTDTHYIGASWNTTKRAEIRVEETEIWITYTVDTPCPGQDGIYKPCFTQTIKQKVICIQEEMNGKYRVQKISFRERGADRYHFTCMRFIQRAPGVVQLFTAVPQGENEDRLCRDATMDRKEWPWIDRHVTQREPCQFSGGFDFRVKSPNQGCSREMAPSRVESECMVGDGLVFHFPSSACNFFSVKSTATSQRLECVTSWKEHAHLFLLLAQANQEPRYVLRLPAVRLLVNMTSRYNADLYMSPFTPSSPSGDPPTDVTAVDMNLWTHIDRHPNESPISQCLFEPSIRGQWVMYHTSSRTDVHILQGHVTVAGMGTPLLCKARQEDIYKTLAVFNNGCRPRYSCLHIQQRNNETLYFRLSQSSLTDDAFEFCQFDGVSTNTDHIRSTHMKTLFNRATLRLNTCGMEDVHHVSVLLSNGDTCKGSMTDVSMKSCHMTSTLNFTLPQCPPPYPSELHCIALAKLGPNSSMLVLQHPSLTHQCYIVQPGARSSPVLALQYTRTACDTALVQNSSAYYNKHHVPSIFSIDVYKDRVVHGCTGRTSDHSALQPSLSSHPDVTSHVTSSTSSLNELRDLSRRTRARSCTLCVTGLNAQHMTAVIACFMITYLRERYGVLCT